MITFPVSINEHSYDAAYIDTPKEALKAVTIIKKLYPEGSKDILGVDIETAGIEKYKPHAMAGLSPFLSEICLVQIYLPKEKTVFLFRASKLGVGYLKELLETRNFVAHFAQFETQHFLHKGIVPQNLGCSQMLFRLLTHAKTHLTERVKTNLVGLAKVSMKIDLSKEEQVSDWGAEELREEQLIYAARDAILTQEGAAWCARRIQQYDFIDLAGVYKLNKKAQLAIAQMSLNGIQINKRNHNKLIKGWEKELRQSEKELREILPESINMRSTKQMSAWIEERLGKAKHGKAQLAAWPRSPKTGLLKSDADTLHEREHLPFVKPLMRYKKMSKLVSTYGSTLQNLINPKTQRIHANYSQCFTGTGRMSSFKPNLQNFPRDPKMRDIFTAKKDYLYVCADYGQMEVRVAAHISGDTKMLDAFEEGRDIYITTANETLGTDITQLPKEEAKEYRQMYKGILLGSLFGLGAHTMQGYMKKEPYNMDMTIEECQEAIDKFRKAFPEFRQWQIDTGKEAERTLMSSTMSGKLRRLPPDSYYCKALNTPVQGTAAEIMHYAGINVDTWIRENNSKAMLVNLVHDEVLAECPTEELDPVMEMVKDGMERAMHSIFPNATLTNLVEVGFGKTWGSAK